MQKALLFAWFAAVPAALAGCFGGSDGPDLGSIEVTPDTGGIRGVVVDEAIRPVGGATVEVLNTDQRATTAGDGTYRIAGLAPGSYAVKASHPLYSVAQQVVDVVAGDAEPPATRFQLVRVVFADPYTVVQKFDGFIACSVGIPNAGYSEECGEGVGMPCEVPVVGCQRVGGQDNNLVQYDFHVDGPQVRSLTVELAWEPTSGETGAGQLYHVVATDWACTPSCEGNRLGDLSGASPLHIYVGPEALAAANLTAETTVTSFTWAAFEDQAAPNVVVNQDYQLFVTASYHVPLDEGWSFVKGDDPPY